MIKHVKEADKNIQSAGTGELYDRNHVFNMLLNIGLLVLLATLLTNMASVRKLFRGESSTIIQKMALAVIFGAISIVSTYNRDKDRRGHRQYPRHRRSDSRGSWEDRLSE